MGIRRKTRDCIDYITKEPEDPYTCQANNEALELKEECDKGYCPGYLYLILRFTNSLIDINFIIINKYLILFL